LIIFWLNSVKSISNTSKTKLSIQVLEIEEFESEKPTTSLYAPDQDFDNIENGELIYFFLFISS